MRIARLIKLAPTTILVGSLGYSWYAMESGLPGAAETQADVQKGLDRMVQEVLAESSTAASKLEGKLRDPFWVAVPKTADKEVAPKQVAGPAESDELAEMVRGMTLDATFLQGREQLAVIDGRIYGRGQNVAIPEDPAMPGRSLQLIAVTRTGVLLKGAGKHYALGYPDRLGKKKDEGESGSGPAGERAMAEIDPAGQVEMFQRLLNSPLGAMGRGLIGDAATAGRTPGGARKSGARRSPDPGPRASRGGGP